MCHFQKAFFFALLCIFLCKRSIHSCSKRYATRQWKFISASGTVGDRSSTSRCVFKAPKLKGRKKFIQAQDNANLEKIKKLSFTYVTDIIVKVIGQISKAKAHTITVEAHSTGQALILSTWRSQAERYCEELQKNGLTVSIIHESQLKEKKKGLDAGS
ncbi:ATP-dependent Clp protease adaptor protein ClpS containing protein [Plasmodium cynomolgi strain B]|uniref:ATP-dependent Clp protease adaptor protein ClpS containing protein n=1 Tax=Plasmodium cynomolgi (strain B) TaxID=1120755 RepID=K6UYB7_PLACD|nr:ATP-dependent Clp protease adaptor protein ClpS containing protein [Plasmodium cynomolgi strain B]GAB68864.1 ATP-dependent Clp protease adaptor protein ClpS containing protein [Plasmodium cynomolgi strain B]